MPETFIMPEWTNSEEQRETVKNYVKSEVEALPEGAKLSLSKEFMKGLLEKCKLSAASETKVKSFITNKKLVPEATKACRDRGPKVLPLQFDVAGGRTAERQQATMFEIYKAKRKPLPAGWNDTDVIQVKVTFSLTWEKKKKRSISKVIVNGNEEVSMKGPASLGKGDGNKYVLPVTRMEFLPKGEKLKRSEQAKAQRRGTKGNGGWLPGDQCGPKLRKVFENPEATKDELLAVADQYIEPPDPQYNVKDDCFLLRSGVAGRRVGRGMHYGCVGPTDAVARMDAKIQVLGNCLSWRDTDNIEEDPIYKRMKRVCPAIQAAARLSLLKKPYKGKKGPGRLDEFTVKVLTAQEKAIRDEYVKECGELERVPRVDGVEVPSRSFNNVDGREGRKNHAAVRIGVERALQLVPVDAAVRGAVDAAI